MAEVNKNHYVSQFLTKPWRTRDGYLWFYDFDTRTIAKRRAKDVFQRLDTSQGNSRLNVLVETPLSRYRRRLTAEAAEGVNGICDPEVWRALAMLLILQPLRANESRAACVSDVVAWDDRKLAELVGAVSAEYRFVRLKADPAIPLCYPSSGFFVVPAERRDGHCDAVLAIPLTERYAAAAVPMTVDVTSLPSQWGSRSASVISRCSVGASSRQVVIHPSAVEGVPREELCARIEEARRETLELVRSCADVNKVLAHFEEFACKTLL